LKKTLKENDLLLTMGAGDISSWVAKLPLLLGPEETK
jgi:UDP-N-acetylmuramate-alanine ligase